MSTRSKGCTCNTKLISFSLLLVDHPVPPAVAPPAPVPVPAPAVVAGAVVAAGVSVPLGGSGAPATACCAGACVGVVAAVWEGGLRGVVLLLV